MEKFGNKSFSTKTKQNKCQNSRNKATLLQTLSKMAKVKTIVNKRPDRVMSIFNTRLVKTTILNLGQLKSIIKMGQVKMKLK